jgi:hypothetical protein
MPGSDYHGCVLAFTRSVTLRDGEIKLENFGNVLVMKCLREMDDEIIVKKACEKYKLNIVRGIIYCTQTQNILSPSDWAAVIFVCKHMNNLKHLQLYIRRLRKMIVFWKSVNYYNKDVSKVWC